MSPSPAVSLAARPSCHAIAADLLISGTAQECAYKAGSNKLYVFLQSMQKAQVVLSECGEESVECHCSLCCAGNQSSLA